MNTLTTLLIVLIAELGFSQKKIDYKDIRNDLYMPVCGWQDSSNLNKIIPAMRAYDVRNLKVKDLSDFYYDLSMAEYQSYAYTMNVSLLKASIDHGILATQYDPDNFSSYWNVALGYHRLKEFDLMESYLQLYELRTPKKYLDDETRESIAMLRKRV